MVVVQATAVEHNKQGRKQERSQATDQSIKLQVRWLDDCGASGLDVAGDRGGCDPVCSLAGVIIIWSDLACDTPSCYSTVLLY